MLVSPNRFIRPSSIFQVSGFSTEVLTKKPYSEKLAQFKNGNGGLARFSGNAVTVFGATGFMGKYVVNHLAKDGNQLILPYRLEPDHVRKLQRSGELGQILAYPFDLTEESTIKRAVKYSNVVVNLISNRTERKGFRYLDLNMIRARRIARMAREMGVERFIHISILNASENPEPALIRGGSNLLKSKALGEVAVREEFPDATIIRPAITYGEMDGFINYYVSRFRKTIFDKTYIYRAGEQTYKMPIFVDDVARGIAKAANDPNTIGKTYEFVGPHCYKFSDLLDYMYTRAHCTPQFGFNYKRHGVTDPVYLTYMAGARLYSEIFQCYTPLMKEWMEVVEGTNDVLTGALTLQDLGIDRLTEFEDVGGKLAEQCSFIGKVNEDLPAAPLPLRLPQLIKGKFDLKELRASSI